MTLRRFWGNLPDGLLEEPEGHRVFLLPLTLTEISRLRNPAERVPLDQRIPYQKALDLIAQGALKDLELSQAAPLRLKMIWDETPDDAVVTITEADAGGAMNLACSLCLLSGRHAVTCPHQWASFVLLWQTLSAPGELRHPSLVELAKALRETLAAQSEAGKEAEFSSVDLDSVSFFPEESALLKGASLAGLLPETLGRYKKFEVVKGRELLSPRLWNLPEIFRRKVIATSQVYFRDLEQQNRVADFVRYNFSNGMQISAKEILRHPLQRRVPGQLLPQAKSALPALGRWPLSQRGGAAGGGASPALSELEEIMQALLVQLIEHHRRGALKIFLQSSAAPGRALPVEAFDFDAGNEVDWRVDFAERKELETEFKLVSSRKTGLHFFESFAIPEGERVLLVHPWLREFSELQEVLARLPHPVLLPEGKMPGAAVTGEFETKAVLKHLRSRSLPVKLTGGSLTLEASRSLTQVHLDEAGRFFVQHDARVPDRKNMIRRGWTTKSSVYLHVLSEGLPFLLNAEPREIAARTGTKRDWDLKLLKHLGILQYLALETLNLHFTGSLTDGTVVPAEGLFGALHGKIQNLLTAGNNGVFVREMPLGDLCSKAVLSCFEDFVGFTRKSMASPEAFYSAEGEVVLEGVTDREFRLIHEVLKDLALGTGGEAFRRSRTPLLERMTAGEDLFRFPAATEGSALHAALESLQELLPFGFRIYFKDQPLQELAEGEFRVDFLLKGDADPKMFNWFELSPKFFLLGEEVDPDQLLSIGRGGVIEYGGKLYMVPRQQMPSLRRLEAFWKRLQKGKAETAKKKGHEKIYQLPRSQTLELLALRASGVTIRGDETWRSLCEFYDGLGSRSRELKLPASMRADLKPYQATGIQWLQDLYRLRLGALLADDMGLGKTLQTLAFLDDLRDKGDLGQVLIVVPSSLIFNWQQEVEKFTPQLPLTVFSGRDRDRIGRDLGLGRDAVVITTYGLLMEHEAFLSQFKWNVLIFDEAQNLKNITTKRTSAARALTARFKICLTGTPMENHYGEFYSLVDLLVPGSLGKIDEFRRRFVNTETVTREEIDDLKLKIKPLLMRRTKKEILDQLPEKQETKVSIAFEEKQKEIYRDIALSYNQRVQETMAVQGEASVQLQMLTALLRLRQACSDPAALPNVKYDKVPPKLETLLDSIGEIVEAGESALVFTQFLQTLEHSAALLREAGVPVFILHGGIPTKQRQKVLADFNQVAGGAVLLMTLKTGGVGLNLTKASYVFHLEPWWNPSVENQATDRAHRLGQSKAVQVFRYIMHESLEEKIELLKDRKDRKFQALLSVDDERTDLATGSAALTKDDFDLLLGLK